MAPVRQNAELLGNLFEVRLGECSSDPVAATVVSENAPPYSVRYELEPGLKRCAFRISGTNACAWLLSLDLPQSGPPLQWFLYEILCEN